MAFAVQADIPGLGEYALGLILILAGIIVLVLHFVILNQWRRPATTDRVVEHRDVVSDRAEVVEEPVVERRVRRRFY